MRSSVRGTSEAIAHALRTFQASGFTQVEVILWPPTLAALEAMAPLLELLDGD